MENILINFDSDFTKQDIFLYFIAEIFCVIGIVLNLFLHLFFKRKDFAKKISDIFSCSVFLLNISTLGFIGIYNAINKGLAFNEAILSFLDNFDLKIIVNIFLLFFLFSTYKIARRTRIKAMLLNSILLAICFCSGLLMQSCNFVFTFVLLDLVIFFIYKYASNSRIRKEGIYSKEFILTSISSSILFYAFYLTSFFIKDATQLCILDVCTTLAILLKIGIFPVYNYLNNRNYKSNLPYAILLFIYLPFVGIIAFNKMISKMSLLNEVYQITILLFAVVSFICFALFILKQKNIVKFLSGVSYCFANFSIINIIFVGENYLSIKHCIISSFAFLAIFSLLCILKINYYSDKINLSAIKGIFVCNKKFAAIFSVLLLIITSILPSGVLKYNLEMAKNMYVFDSFAVLFLVFAMLANLFATFNSFMIIRNCYAFDKNKEAIMLTKRTTLNYVVPFVIICFLLISLFL